MSKYTTQVRFICESYSGLLESKGYDNVDEIIENARSKIFNFEYPIFDEKYKSVIETKILKHYYTREIGAETVGLWKLWLNTTMNEIMPYYNKLYKSELIEFDPLHDVDLTRTHTLESIGDTENTTNTENSVKSIGSNSNNHWRKYSDTPQGSLVNIESGEYLSEAEQNTSDILTEDDSSGNSKTVGNSVATSTEEYLETIKGKTGGYSSSKMIMQYRDTFLNIDMQVIGELKDLFMNVW